HLVFTDREVYVERNERIDYFGAGELGRSYADWRIWWSGHGTITCDQDGRAHRHGVEELVARPPERGAANPARLLSAREELQHQAGDFRGGLVRRPGAGGGQ